MNIDNIWDDDQKLIPAIIQDKFTKDVLMLGYMNKESFRKTLESYKVTFFSRSRKKLWTKGETSGTYLNYCSHKFDCDEDAKVFDTINPETFNQDDDSSNEDVHVQQCAQQ